MTIVASRCLTVESVKQYAFTGRSMTAQQRDFERLREGLAAPQAYPHPVQEVEQIETHISLILLAGQYAYKLKKPVALGFLDFSTLGRRRHYCEEELRLNRRLAADIYLGVEPITGSLESPRIGGGGEAIEYAVKMRRFPQEALLDQQAPTPDLIDRLAAQVARFHGEIPAAGRESSYGSKSAVITPMRQNFDHIRRRLSSAEQQGIDRLAAWTEERVQACHALIDERRTAGHIRECHGDMHRGNIAVIDGEIVIFDAIEFNPDLRWIDTISEVAFLVMDLDESGYGRLARRFLNQYLQLSGDYDALPLLGLYKVYRAMVRAKVIAIRLGQGSLEAGEERREQRDLERYLALAESYTRASEPVLILTHGVSGSGKSWLATALVEALDAVHVRSDIERKRLFGLSAEADSAAIGDIYTSVASQRTYERLLNVARAALAGGQHVVVDATFLRRSQRKPFLELAATLARTCRILAADAPLSELRRRLMARQRAGGDPSEADMRVVQNQLASQEPLDKAELALTIQVDTRFPPDVEGLAARLVAASGTDQRVP